MSETLLKSQQAFGGDGWQPAKETWAYASATTITVPSGAASKYQKGDKIKFTQTTVKYAYIVTVADTLLTVVNNGAVVVADAAISANYYSHQENPMGFPDWFDYSPTLTWTNKPTSPTQVARFKLEGKMVHFYYYFSGTASGSNSTAFIITGPIQGAYQSGVFCYAFSALITTSLSNEALMVGATATYWAGNNTICVNFASGNYRLGLVSGEYEIV
jgi:hypothetical protein